jgi:hypothetical protein
MAHEQQVVTGHAGSYLNNMWVVSLLLGSNFSKQGPASSALNVDALAAGHDAAVVTC